MKKLLLKDIRGQKRAIDQTRATLDSIFREPDSPHRPILIDGPSSVGKTLISEAMEMEFVANGWRVVRLADSSEARCLVNVEALLDDISDGQKTVVFIDECQALLNGKGSEGVTRAFRAMILPFGGEPVASARIPVSAGNVKEINFCNVQLVFMTNEADSLESKESRAKGDKPMQRRFNRIELKLYTHAEMQEIIPIILKQHELQSTECSRGIISRFHRGNMTPINEMVSVYKKLYPGEARMSKEKVLKAASLTSFLPRGLFRLEGRLLKLLAESEGKRVRKSFLSNKLGVDGRIVQGCLAYLDGQQTDGAPTPFIEINKSDVVITKSGEMYYNVITKEGFTF